MLVLLSLALCCFLVYLLGPILAPFVVGVAIAYLGDPIVDRLETKLGRTGGVVVVFVLITLLFLGMFLLLLPLIVAELTALVKSLPGLIEWVQQTVGPILMSQFGVDPLAINIAGLKAQLAENWGKVGGVARILIPQLVTKLTASGLAFIVGMANIVLIPVVSFYLMRDWRLLVGHIKEILPEKIQPVASLLAAECDEVLSAFIRGQMLVMGLLGCIYSAGLMLLGLELGLIIGMLAGLASIVPYMGFLIGICMAGIAAVVQFNELLPLVYVAIVFGIGQTLEGTVLTPMLVGDRIGLHPVAVIFAIMAGGQLFGFVGVLIALPVAAVIMVLLRFILIQYKTSAFYSTEIDSNIHRE
ncbi:MAG: AI-2E family transporter [Pseudomonadales bacterium]|nr:AI-2E family transporter [Pseudomonadales bacterium]